MEKEKLYNVMLDNKALLSLSVVDLQQLVMRFPYFQTARILLLKKMKEEESIAFDRELKKLSIFVGDRAKLYVYLHSCEYAADPQEALPELSLITTSGERDDSVSASYTTNADTTFNYLFYSEEEARTLNQEEIIKAESELLNKKSQQHEGNKDWDLIDRFMHSDAKKRIPADDDSIPKGNLAENSVQENPTILTETLAKIYIKQEKYDKAVAIFKSLSLKFPNKNAYFAARIKELEILIKSK